MTRIRSNTMRFAFLATLAVLGAAGVALLMSHAHDAASPATHAAFTRPRDSAVAPVASSTRRAAAQVGSKMYAAPVGQEMTFELRAGSSSKTTLTEHNRSAIVGLAIAGSMRVCVLDRRDGALITGVSFPGCRVAPRVEGGTPERGNMTELERALAATTLVLMGDDGQTRGYRFDETVAPEHRHLLRKLIAALRFVARPGEEQWTVNEADGGGVFATEYRWTVRPSAGVAGILDKKRPSPASALAASAANVSAVGEGNGRATFGAALGWIEQAEYQERGTHAISEMACTVQYEFTAAVRLQSVRVVSERTDVAWTGAWQPADGARETLPRLAGVQEARYRQLLDGVDADQLVAEIGELVRSGAAGSHSMFAARQKLAWLVRLRPEALPRLQQYAIDPSLDPQTMSVIVTAVGGAQTDAAQIALSRWCADVLLPESIRVAAAASMMQLQLPNQTVRDTLAGLLASDAASTSLQSAALLVLGAVSTREPAGPGEVPASAARLLAYEPLAPAHGTLATWLEALGNTGRSEAIPVAQRHLAHVSDEIRIAALASVRRVAGEAATAVMVAALDRDPSPMVRVSAAELVASRTDASALVAVERVLRQEPVSVVRRAAIVGLGARATQDTNAARLLRLAAASDADSQLRALAVTLLQGRRG